MPTTPDADFLADGIMSFRDMLRQVAEQKLLYHFLRFYSNRRPEDAAFLEEMEESARSRKRSSREDENHAL
ncbi:MAG: hypothetical protein ACREAB_00750 [Blastocatellia bacterium]